MDIDGNVGDAGVSNLCCSGELRQLLACAHHRLEPTETPVCPSRRVREIRLDEFSAQLEHHGIRECFWDR